MSINDFAEMTILVCFLIRFSTCTKINQITPKIGGKSIFGKKWQITRVYSVGQKFCRNVFLHFTQKFKMAETGDDWSKILSKLFYLALFPR